eukprot:SAG31_NODE_75_length_27561_cov_28.859333_4_plen_243_part_00
MRYLCKRQLDDHTLSSLLHSFITLRNVRDRSAHFIEIKTRAPPSHAGVAPTAHARCYMLLDEAFEVSDDPAFRTSAGQGGWHGNENYDASLAVYDTCGSPYPFRTDMVTYYETTYGGPFQAGGCTDGEPAWFKLPQGRSLPRTPPGGDRCGTEYTSWLSGWQDMPPAPGINYAEPARTDMPPPLGESPANGTVCFDSYGTGGTHHEARCGATVEVSALRCGDFELWLLPPAPECNHAYCLSG